MLLDCGHEWIKRVTECLAVMKNLIHLGPYGKEGHLNTTKQKLLLWEVLHLTVIKKVIKKTL